MQPMSPEQCRAARGWLGWSQKDLAKKASVGVSTVKDFENGARKPIANNLAALQQAIELAGISLIFDKEMPVGLKTKGPA
jgi:ribosome-binding protein aMBF1 (putative translation factor)